jgi:UDP-N-acetylmuramoyl-tripeptide--D-alanyl-D-alanine ligase
VLQHEDARSVVGNTACTQHNMNCDRGLPLTILRYDNWPKSTTFARLKLYAMMPMRALRLMTAGSYPDVLVLEYAAGPGSHMKKLSRLVPPDVAVVTTIGPAHLDRMKTVDAVAREKGNLVQAVSPTGLVVLGQDHDHVDRLEALARSPVIKLPGQGMELSARIAQVVARHLGSSDAVAEAALADFEPSDGRLKLWQLDHLTLIDDSYNANPLSMKLGLEALHEIAPPGARRLAILGEMAELGEEAPRFHQDAGVLAHRCADLIAGVGELARHYGTDRWYPTSRACAEDLEQLLEDDDCVLVKGSHAAHMGPIVQKLKKIGREGLQGAAGVSE